MSEPEELAIPGIPETEADLIWLGWDWWQYTPGQIDRIKEIISTALAANGEGAGNAA